MEFLRQLRPVGNLLTGWAELLHSFDREATAKERVQGRANRSMMLDHALGKPVRSPGPFQKVIVDWPSLSAIGVNGPAGLGGRHVDRVLGRED